MLNDDEELYSANLYPAAALKLLWESTPPPIVLSKAGVALLKATPAVEETGQPVTPTPHSPTKKPARVAPSSRETAAPGKKNVPKWLKLGK